MPRLDGYGLLKAVRDNPATRSLPFILITARAGEEELLEGLAEGADEYIAKPFGSKEIVARVTAMLRLHENEEKLQLLNATLEARLESQLEYLSKTKRLFRYFPRRLLQKVVSGDDGALSGRRMNISVMFADLVGFTSLTDRLEPEQITAVLNAYLNEATSTVDRHGGTVVQILGDGLMAFWGAPDPQDARDQAEQSVRAAVAMNYKLEAVQRHWRKCGLDLALSMRIGISQGFATVGSVGSEDLLTYMAIGTTVNLAARLEAKCSPGAVAVSYPIFAQTEQVFPYGDLVEQTLRGIPVPVRVAELRPEACYVPKQRRTHTPQVN